MNYFLIIDGHQAGPYTKENLLGMGVRTDTPVWREGMADWQPAGTLAELNDLFYERPPIPPNGQQSATPGVPIPHFNWMSWAIVGTICGLLFSCIGVIFGILGINAASKANAAYDAGNKAEGDSNQSTAKTMTIIALVISGLGIIGSIFYGAAVILALSSSL